MLQREGILHQYIEYDCTWYIRPAGFWEVILDNGFRLCVQGSASVYIEVIGV